MGSLKFIIRTAAWLILILWLSSCIHITKPEPTDAVIPTSTITIVLDDEQAATLPIPTITRSPSPVPSETPPTLPTSTATLQNERIYYDSQGWYSVQVPIDWKETGKPDSLSGENGFFETGYLPEMGYIPSSLDVCVWLANIDSEPVLNSVYFAEIPEGQPGYGCVIKSTTENGDQYHLAVFENPSANVEQRYAYIKADEDHFDKILASFSWIRPVDYEAPPAWVSAPIRSEDSAFWESTTPVSNTFTKNEYKLLPDAQNKDQTRMNFLDFIPPEAPPIEYDKSPTKEARSINEQLKPLGYEWRAPTEEINRSQLFKDGELLFDYAKSVTDVYTFSTPSGTIWAFLVNTVDSIPPTGFKNYLVQNDTIIEWGNNEYLHPRPPILYNGKMLWVREAENEHIHVQTSEGDILFDFATYYAPSVFKSWGDSWILESTNFLIQDGEILNEKYGFEEIFTWRLIDGKPFYFFRKGPKMGMSYDGQFYSLGYDEIAHGFG